MSASSRSGGRFRRALMTGLLAVLLALVAEQSGWVDGPERAAYDLQARLLAGLMPPDQDDEVVLILVDEQSLEWALDTQGQGWPWPREYPAVIADFARRAGAASLTFDVLYTDDSRFGVHDDRRFARAAADFGPTVFAALYGEEAARHDRFPQDAPVSSATVEVEGAGSATFPAFSRATFPVTELAQSAARMGNVHITPDPDGVYRRAPPMTRFDGELVPGLGLAAFLAGAGESPGLRLEDDGRALRVGDRRLPLDPEGRLILRFERPGAERTRLRAAAVIQSELRLAADAGADTPIDPAELEGRHVMVGLSAAGLFDLRPLPLDPRAPGVEFHATMLENLTAGRFMREVDATRAQVLVGLLAFLPAFLAGLGRSSASTALAIAFALVAPVLLSGFAHAGGVWLPLVVPLVAGLTGTVGAAVYNYAREGRERRFIKAAFAQYLSPQVIERLLEEPDRLKLGGERRELTIFFSDLEGFTSLSERLSPDELTRLLNEYLTEMTDILTACGATIDKYEGDAIIAFWNAPVDVPDHPRRAVEAALECQRRLAAMAPRLRGRAGRDLAMRIGVNTGEAVVGNMGSRTRFDYTMLGDAVNLAARLEGANKVFGTYTLIAESTVRKLPETLYCRELGEIRVVGRARPVRVYEPVARLALDAAPERYQVFARALQTLRLGRVEEARALFASIADRDPPAARYVERCTRLLERGEAGDGVWELDAK
nr:adenylate/guanylate cyclase domain-containing protein [Thioalkalivibrio sp. ALE23]